MRRKHGRATCTLTFVLALLCLLPAMAFAAGGTEGAAEEGPMEITWMYRFSDSWFIRELNEKFNVVIKANGIYINDGEKRNLMLASGEEPEVFAGFDPLELYEDGVIRSIPKDFILKYAPGIAKVYDDRPMAWLMDKAPSREGEYLGLVGFAENADGPIYWPSFRSDYVSNVGVTLPGYEDNKVCMDKVGRCYYYEQDFPLQWFESLLVAFRDGDPDGNGKVDTIPMSAGSMELEGILNASMTNARRSSTRTTTTTTVSTKLRVADFGGVSLPEAPAPGPGPAPPSGALPPSRGGFAPLGGFPSPRFCFFLRLAICHPGGSAGA